MAQTWTREAVLELIGDDMVGFLDREAKRIPLPDWAGAASVKTGAHTTGQRVASVHPDQRQGLIELWWKCAQHPGEVFDFEYLAQGEHGWSRELTRQINLLDVDGINAVIATVRYLGKAEAADMPDVVQKGEYEVVNTLIHELDDLGVIIKTEGKVLEISGRRPEDVIGQSVLEHLHPDGFDDAIQLWMEVQLGPPGTSRACRQRVLRPDGSVIWVESMTIKRLNDDGTTTNLVICHDLTERRKQESALRTSQLEFRLLADQVPGAVFQADADHRISFRNKTWSEDIDTDVPVEYLHEIVHPSDRLRYNEELMRLAARSGGAEAEFEVRSRDGDRIFAITCQSVLDLVNESRSFVGAVTDITSTVKLRERAERDALTGLLNRTALEEHLQRVLAGEPKGAVVVFVDLDEFKAINDEHGHDAGDAVLVEVGRRLADRVRPDDAVARFGGDEFVIVMSDVELSDDDLLQRLAGALDEPIAWEDGSWKVQASFGIARPSGGDELALVLRHADREMFANKRQRKQAARSRPLSPA